MTKSFFNVLFSAILLVGIVSCKGPEGPTGPQGATGSQGATGTTPPGLETSEDGFINFTISGNRQDGTPFSYTESFKTYIKENDPCTLGTNGTYLNLTRSIDAASAIWGSNYFRLGIDKNNPSTNCTLEFRITKELSPTTKFQILGYMSNSANPSNINCTANYNANTHKLTGSFSSTISASSGNNSTGHDIIISNGSFESSVVEIINRPAE